MFRNTVEHYLNFTHMESLLNRCASTNSLIKSYGERNCSCITNGCIHSNYIGNVLCNCVCLNFRIASI